MKTERENTQATAKEWATFDGELARIRELFPDAQKFEEALPERDHVWLSLTVGIVEQRPHTMTFLHQFIARYGVPIGMWRYAEEAVAT